MAIEAPTACRHCGLPVPADRRSTGDSFCCDGCERVRALLLGEDLGRFYDLRGAAGAPPPDLKPQGRAWLDRLLPPGGEAEEAPRRLTLDVQGVHCAACVWLLRELFLRRSGAVDLRINPSRGQADLVWFPSGLDLRSYLDEVERFGYRFGPRRKAPAPASSGLLVRLAISAAAAGNVMLFSIAYYAGLGSGDPSLYALFGGLSLALTAIAVAAGGSVFFRSALAGLRARVAHLDLPIALGIALAFAGSVEAHLAKGPEHAYYDTVATFITLMLAGRLLQERALERNRSAVLASDGIEHLLARRARDGGLETVPASEIETGDELCVVPGDLVPVESAVLGEPVTIALDWITGESETREAVPGATVPAGAFNAGRSPARLASLEPFADSRLRDLLDDPAPSGSGRDAGPAARFWHRLGTGWVAGVLVLAAAGFVAWLPRGLEAATSVAAAVLVVTCPCAIGLAVPLGRELGQAGLRRAGIFVRDGTFLDRALRIRTVLFDKTGTLTHGSLALEGGSRAAIEALDDRDRAVLLAMTSRSNHPVSRAISEAAGRIGAGAPRPARLDGLREVPGAGLEADASGTVYRLGTPSFASPGAAGGAPGETWLSRDGALVARLALAESLKADVRDEVARLAEAGLAVRVLSGDRPEKVRAVAAAIGIPADACEGGLEPEAKADRVKALDRADTLMVGDGINDAPAFAAAFATATPAVDQPSIPARADFYFLGGGIASVRRAIETARAVRRVQTANLAFSLAYNVLTVSLCLAGRVNPLSAAILMPASSLAVVGHTIARLGGRRTGWRS